MELGDVIGKVTRCEIPGCPRPVILIWPPVIATPEELLAIQAERDTKVAAHMGRHHE